MINCPINGTVSSPNCTGSFITRIALWSIRLTLKKSTCMKWASNIVDMSSAEQSVFLQYRYVEQMTESLDPQTARLYSCLLPSGNFTGVNAIPETPLCNYTCPETVYRKTPANKVSDNAPALIPDDAYAYILHGVGFSFGAITSCFLTTLLLKVMASGSRLEKPAL